MSDASANSGQQQNAIWLPPRVKPAALGSLLDDIKRQADQKLPKSSDDEDSERFLEACPGLLLRYQRDYVPWYQRKVAAVPSDGLGFALDAAGSFDADCVQRLTSSLCGFLTYLLAAAQSSDEVNDDFTAEDLELYTNVIIKFTELQIVEHYGAEKAPAILARVVEVKPGVRSELEARQRLLIEEHELPTDQELHEAQAAAAKAEREALRVAQLPPWEKQIYEDNRLIEELQRKLPNGRVLSLMDLPADVRARALGAPAFNPKSGMPPELRRAMLFPWMTGRASA